MFEPDYVYTTAFYRSETETVRLMSDGTIELKNHDTHSTRS